MCWSLRWQSVILRLSDSWKTTLFHLERDASCLTSASTPSSVLNNDVLIRTRHRNRTLDILVESHNMRMQSWAFRLGHKPRVATSKLGVICLRDENQVGADLFGERIAIFTVRSNSLHTRV